MPQKNTGYVAIGPRDIAYVGADKAAVEAAAGTRSAPLSEQSMANVDKLLKYHADLVIVKTEKPKK